MTGRLVFALVLMLLPALAPGQGTESPTPVNVGDPVYNRHGVQVGLVSKVVVTSTRLTVVITEERIARRR